MNKEIIRKMSKDITTEILVKSGFKRNLDKTCIYEMTGTSNFNVSGFGRKRGIEVEEDWHKCYEVRIYHEYCGLIALVDVKTIGQFNTLMKLMDINIKLKKE